MTPDGAPSSVPAVAFVFLLARRTRTTILLLVVGSIVFGVLGAARYEDSLPQQGPSLISHYNGLGELEIQATVCEEPDSGGQYGFVLLDDISVDLNGHMTPLDGRVGVTTSDPRPLHYGDTLSLRASLETPPQLGDFDYAGYLALSGVYSTAFCPEIVILPPTSPSVTARLMRLNSTIGMAITKILPEPESSLAESLLLGRRGGLPESVSDAFVRTGTAHLLAISGLHLGILVAMVMTLLLAALGRRHYFYVWLCLAVLWTYAVFTGMRPPVIRAAIMASTFLIAELAGRQKHAPTALAFAAAIMVGIEPQLLWRTSFQLSVLAMAGLVLLFPAVRALLLQTTDWVTERYGIRVPAGDTVIDIVAATLSATVAVMPVCVDTFGQLSLVSVPVSLLTLPALPFAVGASGLSGLIALLSPSLAAPLAWIAWLFLTYIIKAVQLFAAWPQAMVQIGGAAVWLTVVYYALLSCVPVLRLHLRRHDAEERVPLPATTEGRFTRWSWALPPLLLAAALMISAVMAAPDGKLHVVFLDAGQGDSILIQTPSGRTMLVDGGPDGRDTCALVDGYLPFWDRSLDVVVLTHPHSDHLTGLLTAIDRYKTSLILEPATDSSSLLQEEWTRRLREASTEPHIVTAGEQLDMADGTHIEFLNPWPDRLTNTTDDTDNNGVVLKVTLGDISFLLTADIRVEAETQLLHRVAGGLGSQVLKVGHHGSNSSSTYQFLAAVAPQIAVISVGADNPYGHPHADVLDRLAPWGWTL